MSTAAWLNEQQARLGALNQHHSGMGTGVGCNSSSWFLSRILFINARTGSGLLSTGFQCGMNL